MNFTNFVNNLNQVRGVVETTSYYGHAIDVTSDGAFVNDKKFDTLEEARLYIEAKETQDDITKEIYEEVLINRAVSIITETHNIKVTEKILEQYLNLASSKMFTIDEAVIKIRETNKLDSVLRNTIDFVLEDESHVIITKKMQNRLNSLLENNQEAVDYMRSTKENFFDIIEQVTGE